MKKVFLIAFGILLLTISCSDGDLQIEVIDFDSVNVDFCTDPVANSGNILFKINQDEALILDLQSGVLNNGVVQAGTTVVTESTVPGQSQIFYRIFSDNVTSNYFCDDFPPVTPTVIEEIVAEDGMVLISTTMSADSTSFIHVIELSGISLVNDNGERITDLTINEFGEVTTRISN